MPPKKIQVIPKGGIKTKWSRAIRYGDLIFTTAHSASQPDGSMPTTAEEQIRACFESLKNTLEAGGSGMDMVLHCDCFLAHREDFALMNEIFDEYFLGADVPTTRSVTEVTFTSPKFLFEIQAVAGVKE
jgi:2-iminobutanoate/2-iminopropanoate deaminase